MTTHAQSKAEGLEALAQRMADDGIEVYRHGDVTAWPWLVVHDGEHCYTINHDDLDMPLRDRWRHEELTRVPRTARDTWTPTST